MAAARAFRLRPIRNASWTLIASRKCWRKRSAQGNALWSVEASAAVIRMILEEAPTRRASPPVSGRKRPRSMVVVSVIWQMQRQHTPRGGSAGGAGTAFYTARAGLCRQHRYRNEERQRKRFEGRPSWRSDGRPTDRLTIDLVGQSQDTDYEGPGAAGQCHGTFTPLYGKRKYSQFSIDAPSSTLPPAGVGDRHL